MMTAAILGMSREFSPPPLRSVRDSGSRFPVCNSGGAARRGGGRRGKRTGARDEIGIGGWGLQNTPSLPLTISIGPSLRPKLSISII